MNNTPISVGRPPVTKDRDNCPHCNSKPMGSHYWTCGSFGPVRIRQTKTCRVFQLEADNKKWLEDIRLLEDIAAAAKKFCCSDTTAEDCRKLADAFTAAEAAKGGE